jgi:hypothetical protein
MHGLNVEGGEGMVKLAVEFVDNVRGLEEKWHIISKIILIYVPLNI